MSTPVEKRSRFAKESDYLNEAHRSTVIVPKKICHICKNKLLNCDHYVYNDQYETYAPKSCIRCYKYGHWALECRIKLTRRELDLLGIGPAKVRAGNLSHLGFGPADLTRSQLDLLGIGPAEVRAGNLSPADLTSGELDLLGIGPAEITAGK